MRPRPVLWAELRKVDIEADTLAAHSLKAEKQIRPRLYLLDEASLTDVHQMQGFLQRLKPADRVIVIGDVKQHASLGAGRIFAELQDAGMQTFQLKQIVRQQRESYREVVQDLSHGQVIYGGGGFLQRPVGPKCNIAGAGTCKGSLNIERNSGDRHRSRSRTMPYYLLGEGPPLAGTTLPVGVRPQGMSSVQPWREYLYQRERFPKAG